MMRFACFSAAAVADEAEEAGAQARCHRSSSRRRHSSSTSLRIGKFFGGGSGSSKKGGSSSTKHSSSSSSSSTTRHDDDVCDVMAFEESPPWSPSTSAALSSAVSLDSACSLSSTSTTITTASCSGSASPSFSGAMSPARRMERTRGSAAVGAAAVILCLVMVMLCGRVGATLLASAAFYLFPRLWRPVSANEAESAAAAASPERELPSATKKKVVKEGFLVRNRKK